MSASRLREARRSSYVSIWSNCGSAAHRSGGSVSYLNEDHGVTSQVGEGVQEARLVKKARSVDTALML